MPDKSTDAAYKIRLGAERRALWEAAARREHLKLAAWIKSRCDAAAELEVAR